MSKVERALKLTNAALEQMREQNRCEGIPSSLICAYSWLEEIADLLQPPADTIPVRVALAMGFDGEREIAGPTWPAILAFVKLRRRPRTASSQ
jgi:hypothetical protein